MENAADPQHSTAEYWAVTALEQVRERGCDAENPSIYHSGDGYHCRCVVCGRCGKHTGNSTQGHYWALCKVTKTTRDFHHCCPESCELEIPDPASHGVIYARGWDAALRHVMKNIMEELGDA